MSVSAAMRVELFKLFRNVPTLFWGFCFIPAVYLVFATGIDVVTALKVGVSENPATRAALAMSLGGNPVMQLFTAVAAAAIFGDDYRFTTWRLIGPRASRTALFWGKWVCFTVSCLAVLSSLALLCAATSGIALLIGQRTGVSPPPNALYLAGIFAASLLDLCVVGSIAAFGAIATRSKLAAILPPFFFSAGQVLVEVSLGSGDAPLAILMFPLLASDTVREWAMGGNAPIGFTPFRLFLATSGIVAWVVVPLCLALTILKRQDWSKE